MHLGTPLCLGLSPGKGPAVMKICSRHPSTEIFHLETEGSRELLVKGLRKKYPFLKYVPVDIYLLC